MRRREEKRLLYNTRHLNNIIKKIIFKWIAMALFFLFSIYDCDL